MRKGKGVCGWGGDEGRWQQQQQPPFVTPWCGPKRDHAYRILTPWFHGAVYDVCRSGKKMACGVDRASKESSNGQHGGLVLSWMSTAVSFWGQMPNCSVSSMRIRQDIGCCIWSLGLQIPGTLMVPAIKKIKKKRKKKLKTMVLKTLFFEAVSVNMSGFYHWWKIKISSCFSLFIIRCCQYRVYFQVSAL